MGRPSANGKATYARRALQAQLGAATSAGSGQNDGAPAWHARRFWRSRSSSLGIAGVGGSAPITPFREGREMVESGMARGVRYTRKAERRLLAGLSAENRSTERNARPWPNRSAKPEVTGSNPVGRVLSAGRKWLQHGNQASAERAPGGPQEPSFGRHAWQNYRPAITQRSSTPRACAVGPVSDHHARACCGM